MTMPERVWVSIERDGVLYAWYEEGIAGDVPYVPESRLLAAEARVRELQAPVMCSVCVGRPLPSGRPCICGDTIRTEAAEMHGLRVRCFELEDENATLRAERDALVAEVARYKELLLTMEMPDA